MSDIYSRIQAIVAEKIDEYGTSITLRVTANAGYDAETDTYGTETITNYSIKGVLARYKSNEVDGTLIRAEDKKFLVAATDVSAIDTKEDVKIIQGTRTWQVIDIKPIVPGDTVLVYKLQVR